MQYWYLLAIIPLIITGIMVQLIRRFSQMSVASDRLTASLSALTTSVDALIAKPMPADDTVAETTVADALDALKARVDAAVVASPTSA